VYEVVIKNGEVEVPRKEQVF